MGLTYPVERYDLVLRDIADMLAAYTSRHRPPPYPRPFPAETTVTKKPNMSQERVREILDSCNPARIDK